jgi:hypothetical protein
MAFSLCSLAICTKSRDFFTDVDDAFACHLVTVSWWIFLGAKSSAASMAF